MMEAEPKPKDPIAEFAVNGLRVSMAYLVEEGVSLEEAREDAIAKFREWYPDAELISEDFAKREE